MELAFEKLAEHGIMGLFLILVIWYFTRENKDLKRKLEEKEEKIQSLNDKIHEMGIEAVSAVKEFTQTLKDLLS